MDKHILTEQLQTAIVSLNNALIAVANDEDAKPIIRGGRGVGNTRRLVDYYINRMWDNPGVPIRLIDHCPVREAHEDLAVKIRKRLELECRNDVERGSIQFGEDKDRVKFIVFHAKSNILREENNPRKLSRSFYKTTDKF